MSRCLELARKGSGLVKSNPLVGCVLVKNDAIIGEGYHHEFGGPHAEVNAINNVKDKTDIVDATAYVSLEPCSHFGKTPPCANTLIEHKVKEVIICNVDSHDKVAGNGIKLLEEAGIKVTTGILNNEGRMLNRVFFCNHEKNRPFVSLKWAESNDGFIAPANQKTGHSFPISNNHAQLINHSLRSVVDAVIVGKSTFLNDSPQLTARYIMGNQPIMVLLDSSIETKPILEKDYLERQVIVFNKTQSEEIGNHSYIACDMSIDSILSALYDMKINHVMVEGGRSVLTSFIESGLWDEAHQFIAGLKINNGVKAPELSNKLTFTREIGNNTHHYYINA